MDIIEKNLEIMNLQIQIRKLQNSINQNNKDLREYEKTLEEQQNAKWKFEKNISDYNSQILKKLGNYDEAFKRFYTDEKKYIDNKGKLGQIEEQLTKTISIAKFRIEDLEEKNSYLKKRIEDLKRRFQELQNS